jgi:hypothetical protein
MISPTDYKIVADQINEIQLIDETAIEFIDFMEGEIEDLSILNEPVDRIKTNITEVKPKLNTRFTTENSISSFVRDLQLHVLNNTIYTDINDYLEDYEIKVGQLFADVSARVGYPISSSNIVGGS